MGSIGNSATTQIKPAITYNEYGFEVETKDYPEIEFTDSFWKRMAELRAIGGFEDYDLRRDVDNKVSELVEQYGDLERVNPDATNIIDRIVDNSAVTSDEFWAGYHAVAEELGIKQRRYTVLDSNMSAWDEKYTSPEQAEAWASEHEGAYVYDTWTRKYRKIGGKNWRY